MAGGLVKLLKTFLKSENFILFFSLSLSESGLMSRCYLVLNGGFLYKVIVFQMVATWLLIVCSHCFFVML